MDRLYFVGDAMKNGPPDISEAFVHRVGKEVNDRRLPVAGEHHTSTSMVLEILGDGRNPSGMAIVCSSTVGGFLDANLYGYGAGEFLDVASAKSESMIGFGPRAGDSRFGYVQPVHRGFFFIW
jgi:hypothetical protein